MRRWLILAALWVAFPATVAHAQPVRDGKQLLSCPDPSVVDADVGGYRYYMICTSDTAPDVFPLRESNDLVHWKRIGSVFARRDQPWWARHTARGGHYWAPALYRIGNRWVLYFAAQHDSRRLSLHDLGGGTVAGSEMLIAVATARSLHGPCPLFPRPVQRAHGRAGELRRSDRPQRRA
jgi:beta-xylosidase